MIDKPEIRFCTKCEVMMRIGNTKSFCTKCSVIIIDELEHKSNLNKWANS